MDKKPRLKVVDKTKVRSPKAKAGRAPKGVLKGYVYAFRPATDEEFSVEVEKARAGIDEGGKPYTTEATYRVTNDTCDCPAGDHSQMCKHVDMVLGSFRGNEFEKDAAETLAEEFLEEYRKRGSQVAVVGALAFADRAKFKRADVLVFSPEGCSTKIIMYAEYKGLLIRAIFLPTEDGFRDERSRARIAWANKRKVI